MLAKIVFASLVARSVASSAECGQDGLCDDTSLVQVKHSIAHGSNRTVATPPKPITCRDPNNCKVYFVIDVQNGYDHEWLKETGNLPQAEFNCGWNQGLNLPDKFFEEVNEELEKEDEWDLFVYTQDWLPGDVINARRGWKFSDYLTITAGNPGADINSKIKYSSFLNKNGVACRGETGCTDPDSKKKFLLHTKSIDDSMSDDLSREDLAEDGQPKPEGEGLSLPGKLTQLGLTKDKTTIVAAGLVTERCVMSAAMTAKRLGYKHVYADPFGTQSSSLGAGMPVPPSDLTNEVDGKEIFDNDRTAALRKMYDAGIGFWKSNMGEQKWSNVMMKFHMVQHGIAIQHAAKKKAKAGPPNNENEEDSVAAALANLQNSEANSKGLPSENEG